MRAPCVLPERCCGPPDLTPGVGLPAIPDYTRKREPFPYRPTGRYTHTHAHTHAHCTHISTHPFTRTRTYTHAHTRNRTHTGVLGVRAPCVLPELCRGPPDLTPGVGVPAVPGHTRKRESLPYRHTGRYTHTPHTRALCTHPPPPTHTHTHRCSGCASSLRSS